MAKTKISEFSAVSANNTDIDGINIAEGCAPSGINDAIRELMAQLKDWQAGTSNDPYVIGSSGSLTLNQGTANGVAYLNGSKVVTSGSALTFDGTNFGVSGNQSTAITTTLNNSNATVNAGSILKFNFGATNTGYVWNYYDGADFITALYGAKAVLWNIGSAGGSEQMRLTSTGLGIGTSSPAGKLSVKTTGAQVDISTSATDLVFEAIDRTTTSNPIDTKFYTRNGTFQWYNGQYTERMRLDSSGNLGLGVTPFANSLTSGGLDLANGFGVFGYNNGFNLSSNAYYNSGWKYKATAYANLYVQSSSGGGHQWNVAASGTAGNAITFTQAMTLTAGGALLVGTTSQAGGSNGLVEVRGNLSLSAASAVVGGYQQIDFAAGAYTKAAIRGYSTSTSDAGELRFYTAPAGDVINERARIDSSGNLLVGTTTTSYSDTNGIALSASQGYILQNHANGTSSGTVYTYFAYNANGIGSITQSGTTAVLYNTTSDQRLKENIVDAPEFGNVIDSIQVRSYDWKADGSHQRAGFVAQELVTVAPEAVHQPADPDEMMAVDYSKLVPMLVKEIQSLRQRVAQLESN